MKTSWINISDEDKNEWEQLCPVNEFRVVKGVDLPSIIPNSLKAKIDSALVVASGTQPNIAYYMVNMNRVDYKAGAIDQELFGLAFVGAEPVASGCLIHHGDWEGRTTNPPQQLWGHLTASGIGNHYPVSELPTENSGSIRDLKIGSQGLAFERIVETLKRENPTKE